MFQHQLNPLTLSWPRLMVVDMKLRVNGFFKLQNHLYITDFQYVPLTKTSKIKYLLRIGVWGPRKHLRFECFQGSKHRSSPREDFGFLGESHLENWIFRFHLRDISFGGSVPVFKKQILPKHQQNL